MIARFRSALAWAAIPALSLAVAATMIASGGWLVYGSAFALPALVQGKVVMVEPERYLAGELHAGQHEHATFVLTNLTQKPVTVTGMRASCTCIGADALPLEIPARGRRSIRFEVHPTDSQVGKAFSQTVDLYLSVPSPLVSVTVLGTVAKQ